MIQAYRRGLLPEVFPFGRRSRMRENLILDSIEAEGVSELAEKKLKLTADMVGPASLTKEGRQSLLKSFTEDLNRLGLLRDLDLDGARKPDVHNSALAIASVYDMLVQAGVFPDNSDE